MTSKLTRRHILGACLAAGAAPALGPAASAGWFDDILGDILGGKKDTGSSASGSGASTGFDAADGVREALRIASTRTIERVGRLDGYLLDKAIHINLPTSLQKVQVGMARFGMSGLLDDVELRLNRAAEVAAPKAKSIFFDAIRTMTIEDALGIVRGPDDAATTYFKGRMKPPLTEAFRPVIVSELDTVGAFSAYDTFAQRYTKIPFVPGLDDRAKDKLAEHGLKYALKGLFHYLAKEEAAIRHDPAQRTTQILKDVFGGF